MSLCALSVLSVVYLFSAHVIETSAAAAISAAAPLFLCVSFVVFVLQQTPLHSTSSPGTSSLAR